jgi:hypothetical protein
VVSNAYRRIVIRATPTTEGRTTTTKVRGESASRVVPVPLAKRVVEISTLAFAEIAEALEGIDP